ADLRTRAFEQLALCDSEIGESRNAVDTDEDILWTDDTVDEPKGNAFLVLQLMDGRQAGTGVEQNPKDDRPGERPRVVGPRGDELRRRGALDVIHDEKKFRTEFLDVVHCNDVGVMNLRSDLSLSNEMGAEPGVLHQMGMSPLDGDIALEAERVR